MGKKMFSITLALILFTANVIPTFAIEEQTGEPSTDIVQEEYLEQQEENKLEKKEFENYKLKTNKILKEFSKILKVVVGQNELNGLDINEIIDTMEGKQNEKE